MSQQTIHKTFFSLLRVGLGSSIIKFFLDPVIISYIILDSFFGYISINMANTIVKDLTTSNIDNNFNNFNIVKLIMILFSPLYSSILNIIYNKAFLNRKIFVINNILNYVKYLVKNAPNEFHDKFSLNEKYESFTSSLWSYDHVVQLLISMISSVIKIITVSIWISYNDYRIGLLILVTNLIMLWIMPIIDKKIESIKSDIKYKELYSDAYYNTVIMEEIRINPILNSHLKENLNSSLSQIVSKYSNRSKYYEIASLISNLIKNILLGTMFIIIYYQNKVNYILTLFLNQNTIFGFSDIYSEFKKTENSSKKNMEELISMLEFLSDYYSGKKINNKINVICQYENMVSEDYNKINFGELVIENLNYELSDKTSEKIKLFKKLNANKIKFNFGLTKNIVLINGKTGSGKSLFTKILSGFTDNNYRLTNNEESLNGFDEIKKHRIIINQKISEDYSFNGNINMKIKDLYPNSGNIDEILEFLHNFNIENKIMEKDLNSKYCEKLSGGERQRVVLSSMIWKIIKSKPEFIIIDEPEKGIDEETMIKIMDFILEKYTGLIFLITHNETIKKKYTSKIQSTLIYNFNDETEIDTSILQIFPK